MNEAGPFASPPRACRGGSPRRVGLRRAGADRHAPRSPAASPCAPRRSRAATSTTPCVLTGTLRPRAQVQVVAEVQARLLKVRARRGGRVGRGRDPGRARRHRLPPVPRPGQGRPGRGRGQPQPRPGREGARREPAEDRRHHRQGPPVGAGGAAGGRGVAGPGPGRGGDRRPAARPHADQGALRRARGEAPSPTPARCSRAARRSSPSWTTRCWSSAPRCRRPTTARPRWGPRWT